jgi:hypothetical protein
MRHTHTYWKERHGRIILKWILDKYDVKPCIGLIWQQLQSHVNTVITWGFIGGESFLTSWMSINFLYSLTYCDNGGISPRIHDVGLRCTWVVIVKLRPDYLSVSVSNDLGGGGGQGAGNGGIATTKREVLTLSEIELWSFSRQPATTLTQLCGLVCSEFNSSWVSRYDHCVSLQTAACCHRLPSTLFRVRWGVL